MKKKITSFIKSKWKLITVLCLIAALMVLVSPVNVHIDSGDRVGSPTFTIGEHQITFTIGTAVYAAGSVDYSCDGAADNVQFQQALDALPANGGKLVVLAGTYQFDAATTVAVAKNDVTIQGVGDATYILGDAGTAIFSTGAQTGWIFSDFRTDAGGITVAGTTDYTISRVTVGATTIGETVRSATFVVAASDASESARAQADYVCDGTADDVQVQAAIDALPVVGGLVQLTEGTFYIETMINVTSNYVSINGMGMNTWLWRTTGHDVSLLSVSGVGNSVSNLMLHGNKDAGAPTLGNNLVITGASRLRLENLELTHAPKYGLYCNNGSDKTEFFFDNIEVLASHASCVYLKHIAGISAKGLVLSSSVVGSGLHLDSSVENYFSECIFDSNELYGVHLHGCEKISIVNSYWGGNNSWGFVYDGDYRDNVGITLIGNHFNDDGQSATYLGEILITPTVDCADFTIIGNWFKSFEATNAGVKLSGKVDTTIITSNNFSDMGVKVHLDVHTGTGCIIRNNIDYISPSEVRTSSGSLTGGAANAILFSWHNPETQDILITKVVVNITTLDGDAANIDVGIADDATYTNGGTEFFDALEGETVQVNDSWTTTEGQQSLWVVCQDSASATDGWVVGKILDNDGASIAGSYYIEYVGK